MAYAILRHQKFNAKSAGKISASSAHCSRSRKTLNADPSLKSKNRWIIDRSNKKDIIASIQSLQPIKARKNAVIAIEVVTTASKDFFENKTPEEINDWADASIAGIAACYGGIENIASAVLHLDESTPHIHAHIVPLCDGKLNARHYCGGRKKLSAIQTTYHNAVKHLGLERGKEKSVAKHTTLREWYSAIETETQALTPKPTQCRIITRPGGFLKKQQTKKVKVVSAKEAKKLAVIAAESRFRAEKAESERDQYYQSWRANELAAQTSLLREIPLEQVAHALGYVQDKKDKHKYKTPSGPVSVTGQKFKPWWSAGRGGGGAIDFVMTCERCDFKSAKEILARAAGIDFAAQEIAKTVYKKEKKELTQTTKAPPTPPARSQDTKDWINLRKYLEGRGISKKIIENWIDQGLVYPQKFGKSFQLIFAHKNGFFRKNPHTDFAGWVKGSIPEPLFIPPVESDIKIRKVAIVESHVDAMAYQTLYPDRAVMTAGSVSSISRCIDVAKKMKLDVILAVDNDKAGNAAASEYPELTRHIPDAAVKDWAELTEKILFEKESEQKQEFHQQDQDDENELRM